MAVVDHIVAVLVRNHHTKVVVVVGKAVRSYHSELVPRTAGRQVLDPEVQGRDQLVRWVDSSIVGKEDRKIEVDPAVGIDHSVEVGLVVAVGLAVEVVLVVEVGDLAVVVGDLAVEVGLVEVGIAAVGDLAAAGDLAAVGDLAVEVGLAVAVSFVVLVVGCTTVLTEYFVLSTVPRMVVLTTVVCGYKHFEELVELVGLETTVVRLMDSLVPYHNPVR